MPNQPNAEMALIAFLKSLPDVDSSKVATTLPMDATKWAETGFIVVTAVGGAPNPYVQLRNPVMQVSTWGANLNSERIPWGRTQALAETLFTAFYADRAFPYVATFPHYYGAYIHSAYPLQEPRKVPEAPNDTNGSASSASTAGYAHVQFDVSMLWKTTAVAV